MVAVLERLDSFVRRQLGDLDGLLVLMAARVGEQIPSAQEVTPERQLEMTQSLRRLTRAAMEIVACGGSLEELGPMIEQTARRRRAQGIELGQTLQVYEVAQQALLDAVSAQLRGHPREASLFPQITKRLLEFQRVATMSVTAGYNSSTEPRGEDRDAEMQTLMEIRLGRRQLPPDDGELGRRLELTLPLTQVTVSVPLGPHLDSAVRSASRANPWSLVGSLEGRLVTFGLRAPQSFPTPRGTAGTDEGAHPSAVAAAVTSAARAADVAAALGSEAFTAAQAAPLAALLHLPEADRDAYVEDCFQSLPASARGRSLLTSVSAALTYGRPGDAARALHVHRHTLDYRLGRFATETGLDLTDPATRFRCAIGLFLLGLMPHRPA